MKREPIVAASIGIGLGVIAGGVVLFQTIASNTQNKEVIDDARNEITPSVIQPQEEEYSLSIQEPQNDLVVRSDSVQITGSASVDSLVVIQSSTEQLTKRMEEENLDITFPLSVGENIISIGMYPDSSNPTQAYQERELRIYYLPSDQS